MGGMIFIAVVTTVYLISRHRWEGVWFKSIILVMFLASIPVFNLSLTNYYYLDKEGIHYNSLTSISEKEYKWDEIAKVHIVF